MINIPISKTDPFTKEFNLEWETIAGNKFFEKILNGTINMVSTKPDTNRLFLTINHLEGKDYLILRHPSKDYMLDIGDKFYILFEDDEVLEFEIEKKSFHLYNSLSDTYKQVFENRIILFKEDLNYLANRLIKDWCIHTSGNRKIEGMKSFGNNRFHNYESKENLQIALKNLFIDYIKIVGKIESYKPLSKNDLKDKVYLTEICYLYLMKDLANEYYKIGISNSPEYREKTLQSEKPTIELIISKGFSSRKIALAFENSLHKSYSEKRLRGEWFQLSEKEVIEIREILK
ncbi:GIY-YIG nuclease family protein [Flavobacterium capsici]|uniref:GIY-YIG nuclease family protein n=1 Tax=Flavobacterium capsici TaxID=3075618 RepID=A0AA96EX84_9FLAO|nr:MULTISPECIES: GIY-YIG nuclease family protein [unclassified Flavobacterium]WNM20283.1 GIY-YIG nuclease family protein [Flavobacterium sp. PMR2A8]WNM21673.1 GIY-YIG nuclease family protein [Flavobacterium sp. PMTSA4]